MLRKCIDSFNTFKVKSFEKGWIQPCLVSGAMWFFFGERRPNQSKWPNVLFRAMIRKSVERKDESEKIDGDRRRVIVHLNSHMLFSVCMSIQAIAKQNEQNAFETPYEKKRTNMAKVCELKPRSFDCDRQQTLKNNGVLNSLNTLSSAF